MISCTSPPEQKLPPAPVNTIVRTDRKSTRLNSSHTVISYAVFCLKKKKHTRGRPAEQCERRYHGPADAQVHARGKDTYIERMKHANKVRQDGTIALDETCSDRLDA